MNFACASRWGGFTAAVTAFAFTAGAGAPERPTFTKDVLPILQENCQECHRPKPIKMSGLVAPFSLMSYDDARPWAKAIAKAVKSQAMPPWFATKDFHGVFRNERTLTEDEIATIVRWVDTGVPQGNPDDAPENRVFEDQEWWVGEPDLVVPLPEKVWVGDEIRDWQPTIAVPLSEDVLPEDRWIRTIEAQADSPAVHHIVVYTDYSTTEDQRSGAGSFGQSNIGGLAPGAEPSLLQDGYGILLKKGATLQVNMHYNKEPGPGTGVYDQSRLGFFFYPKGAEVQQIQIEPIGLLDFEIPPGKSDWTVGMARTFDRPFRVLSYLPHMHVRGVAAEYMAFLPDGTCEPLLNVPRYDYNWQLYYEYPEPKLFPAGTRVEVKMTFDNSQGNESNPDASKPIRFGLETTTAEMALGWMYYSWADEGADKVAVSDSEVVGTD
jgi:mono/diheme cytochrome c family protein